MNVLDALELAPVPGRRRFRAWSAAEAILAGLDAERIRRVLLDDTPPVDYEHRDDLLAALLRLARTDEDAGQFLMLCLLPGVRARLRRHGQGLEREEAAAIMVGALWRRIRTYPLDRRPRRIALNLLLDATHDFIATRDRERAWTTHAQLTDESDLDDTADELGPSPELMWHAATTARVISIPQATLLDATHLRGLPLRDTAALLGMGHAAAKQSRRRGGQRFAHWWVPDDRRHAA